MANHQSFTSAAESETATCLVKPVTNWHKGETQSLKELMVQVQITERDCRKQVCCKSDGMRFAGADTTVKLAQGKTYIISVTTQPAVAVTLEEAELKHRQAECQEPSLLCCCLPSASTAYTDMDELEWSPAVKVPLKERSTASSAQRNVYELSWDNDMALTGRGMRGELAVDVAVQDFGCMTLPILAKVYSSNDSSASHGVPLHSISYTIGRSSLTGEVKLYSTKYNK